MKWTSLFVIPVLMIPCAVSQSAVIEAPSAVKKPTPSPTPVKPKTLKVQNIVDNGGFEFNSKNALPPEKWYVFGAPVVGEKLLWDSTQKHSGKYSLKLMNDKAEDYPNVFQEYTLTPGKYKVTGWLKGNTLSGVNAADQGAGLYIEMYDADKNWASGEYPAGIGGTFDWKKIETVFTVTDKTVKQRLGLYLRKSTTGTAWFDDLKIKKIEEVKAVISVPKK